MPNIIDLAKYDIGLDPDTHDAPMIKPLLRPWHEGGIECYPVSRRVNSPKSDGADLIQPVSI
ncbi:MAG: SOS response-associated peptidase [Candidatus Thiodiazotropha sp. (ex Monitilora ramsayi)]|nr:SOS response-associated peptidase [Candidatus Thiodiazotropha sp. (ex Monitilora ramsayi)]